MISFSTRYFILNTASTYSLIVLWSALIHACELDLLWLPSIAESWEILYMMSLYTSVTIRLIFYARKVVCGGALWLWVLFAGPRPPRRVLRSLVGIVKTTLSDDW